MSITRLKGKLVVFCWILFTFPTLNKTKTKKVISISQIKTFICQNCQKKYSNFHCLNQENAKEIMELLDILRTSKII